MKKIIIFILAIPLLLSSCEDVLQKEPLDNISDAVVWKDPVLIDAYLVECYSEMKFYFEMSYGKNMNWMMDNNSTDAITIGDEAQVGWPSAGPSSPKSNWITIKGGNFEWWGYPTIRKLNIFLDKLSNSNQTEAYKIQRLAEARFLRAFAYFDMVKRYGGVPILTKELMTNSTEDELYPKRNKEQEVYDFILSELDSIVNVLPEQYSSSDFGRPTKYAALALESRAAMYAASIATWGTVQLDGIVGIDPSKASYYWQTSYNASDSIIKSGRFALYDKYPTDKVKNFRNIFLDEGNSETIFSERFDGLSGKGHTLDMLNVPYSYHVWGGGQKVCPYLEMVESFDNVDGTSGVIDRDKIAAGYLWTVDELWGKKDPRFKASIFTMGTSWTWTSGPVVLDYHYAILVNGVLKRSGSYNGVMCRSKSVNPITNFGMLKYLDEAERSLVMERKYSDTDYIIFRLGEIYLNLAEAAIELNKPGEALEAVNKIRERAGMPLYNEINRDLVRKERKVELAFEGNRYFDVIRWRTAVDDLTKDYHNLGYILDGNSYTKGNYDVMTAKFKLEIQEHAGGNPHPYFEEKHFYMPISLTRTGANPNLIENPGYH